jgi:enoyl-CoA hydratase/carnithine racemase
VPLDAPLTTDERVLVDLTDGVATLTSNRPDEPDAIDTETHRILGGLAPELEDGADRSPGRRQRGPGHRG